MEGNEISSPESGSEATATASASSIGNFVSVTARVSMKEIRFFYAHL